MRLFAVVLALALLVVATACAQAPSAAPAVSVTLAPEQGKVSVEQAGKFVFTVRNDGTPPPAGNENSAASDVVVSVSGMPAGWTAAVSPASFELRNGQSREVELQVSVTADAEAPTADLVITAELYSPLEGLEPILGQVQGQSQKATATDTLQVTRDDSVTRDILEAVGPWIYAILLLLVAAVLVAVALSLAARRSLVRLSSDARELTLPPGGRAAFVFKVEGLAKQQDSVLLQVSAVQEGWAAFLPVPELALNPGQVQELTLVVIAPKTASDGARQAVLVSATSAKAPKGSANLEFVATVHSGTALRATKRPKE